MISIGIHIQKHSVRVAELFLKGSSLEQGAVYEYPLDPSLTEEQKQIQISEQLRPFKERYKGEVFRFCYGLPQSQNTCFHNIFPFREKFKIIKTLPFEI